MNDSFNDYFPFFEQGEVEYLPTVGKKLWETNVDGHPPILRLLAVATALKCNLFPLIWSKELEGLGEGATGKISQAPLNKQIAFAYKRFSRRPNTDGSQTHAERMNVLYNAMICELIVLHREEIYDHPNVAKLEGLCWEIVQEFDEVWPVLVFRKAELGDLSHFLTLPDANGLDLDDLVFICGEVAKGLRVMHLSGIVHGDIKPQNVLVPKSLDGEATGFQSADFGYASLGNRDDDLVKLPQSPPWHAPEYSPRWLTMSSAKKMDVYSFGLLVFWLLFRELHIFERSEISVNVGTAFMTGNNSYLEEIDGLKKSDALLEIALRSLSIISGMNEIIQARLKKVFELSLGFEPSSRASDMKPFVELLCKEENLEPTDGLQSLDPVNVEEWHGKPDVADFFFELDACDFRVHKFITKEFAGIYKESDCKACTTNAAYQLALCHQIGFGVFAEQSQSDLWLHRSGISLSDLHIKLEAIRSMQPSLSSIGQIVNLGFRSQLSIDYEDAGILKEASCYYEGIANSRNASLGSTHYSCRRIQTTFADVLRQQGARERAAGLYEEQRLILNEMFGVENASSAAIKVKLAKTYATIHRYAEAKHLYEDVIRYYSGKPDGKHLMVSELYNVSAMMLESGDILAARDKACEAVEQSENLLGPLHASTLGAKDVLAKAYEMLDETKSAISMREEIIKAHTSVLGPNRPETIVAMRKLGSLFLKSDHMHEAKRVFADVLKAILSSDGKTESAILNARANYAVTLTGTGEAVEAAIELQDIVVKMEGAYDADDPSLIAIKMNLATAFNAQSRWDDAEPVWRETRALCENNLSDNADWTLKCLKGLSEVLYHQEKWANAATISAEYVERWEKRQLLFDEDQVYVISMLGRSYARMVQWDKALPTLEREIALRSALDLLDTADGLQARVLVADGYLAIGRQDDAGTQIARLFESFLRTQKAKETMISSLSNLIESCAVANLLEEAEELLKLKVMIKRAFPTRLSNENDEVDDEEKLLKLRETQGILEDRIIFSPQKIIERYKAHEDEIRTPASAEK